MCYFLILFTLALFTNCSSVPKEYLTNDDTCYYNDPVFKISKEEMKIKVDKYIEDFNSYYKNGNLKIKGYFLENDFYSGIWKEYDEQGNLIKETDYDKGFEYKWEDLVKYLEKRKVDIKDTSYYKPKTDEYIEVTLDGKTGKEIKRRYLEFIGNYY